MMSRPVVTCVYFCVKHIEGLADKLREALDSNGDRDIRLVELDAMRHGGGADKISLTEDSINKIPEIEYLYSVPSVIGEIFCHPKCQLKWAQTPFAGCEGLFRKLKNTNKKPNFLLSRRVDGFPQMMGEYVIGQIIARERQFNVMNQNQLHAKWDRNSVTKYRTLDSLTVGVIGLGTIGTQVARMCKAMNMRVLGIVRDERLSPSNSQFEGVDQISPLSQLSSVLEQSDYLVSVLPSTPQTINLLSGDVLKPCHKQKTVFINIGRGTVIDDHSLINAITQGWLGGAVLDVFNQEPLPSSSPLWSLPNVVITPHCSASTSSSNGSLHLATDTFIYNLNAYRQGQPMRYLVDFDKGY